MSLTIANEWSQNENTPSLVCLPDHFKHFLFGVFHHFFTGHVTIGRTCTCKEQTQVVIDLGDGSYSGTWILVGCFLLNADYR